MVARTRKQAGRKPAGKARKHSRANVGFEGIEPLKFHVMPLKAFIMSVHPMWYHEERQYRLEDRTVYEGNIRWFEIPDHLDTIELDIGNRSNGWDLSGEWIGTKEAIKRLRMMEQDYDAAEIVVNNAATKREEVFSFIEKQMCSDDYAPICG